MGDASTPKPRFFESPAQLRAWLSKHHATAAELWVGLYKTGTGRAGLRWPQVVDQALCFGWIDGIRKSIDSERYMNRITPRRKGSNWSAVNIRRMAELQAEGQVEPAGLAAFALRQKKDAGAYSYENRSADLPEPYAAAIRHNAAAWQHYSDAPASYRKATNWWVLSAKQEATRQKRLQTLIDHHASGRRIP